MIRSKRVYITASGFFALIDRNHPKHAEAEAFFRYFAQEHFHLFTASFSVIRAYDQVRRNMSLSLAKEFLRTIYVGNIEIIYPNEAITKAAIRLVLSNTGSELGIELAMINVIADSYQIPQICTFEHATFYFGIQLFSLPF